MSKLIDLVTAEHSKRQTMKIVRFVGDDEHKFSELMKLVFGKNTLLAQRASWPMSTIVKAHPDLFSPYFSKALKQLTVNCHNAIHRNILDAMQNVPVPARYEAKIIEVCFDLLNDSNQFIAIKALSISLLGRMVKKYPELMVELKNSIDHQWEHASAGFRARARLVFKELSGHKLKAGM